MITDYGFHYVSLRLLTARGSFINGAFPKWFSCELKDFISHKKLEHKKNKISNTWDDYLKFYSLKSQCKKLTEEYYDNFVKQSEKSIRSNPKKFWKFVNARKSDTGLPNVIFYGDDHFYDKKDITTFERFFQAVYRSSNKYF